MKALLFALSCLLPEMLHAEGADAPLADPQALSKIVSGLEKSGIAELTSRAIEEEKGSYTYHLKFAKLLGTLTRGKESFFVVSAAYNRSRPADRQTPPARGHGFLVVLRSDFSVASYRRTHEDPGHMTGDVLMSSDQKPLIDFAKTDPLTRGRGYFIEDGFLPYFFADGLSEEQMKAEMEKQEGEGK